MLTAKLTPLTIPPRAARAWSVSGDFDDGLTSPGETKAVVPLSVTDRSAGILHLFPAERINEAQLSSLYFLPKTVFPIRRNSRMAICGSTRAIAKGTGWGSS